MNVEQLVTFAILAGVGDRILHESPNRILEKFEACTQVSSDPFLRQLLDKRNVAIFDIWLKRWKVD